MSLRTVSAIGWVGTSLFVIAYTLISLGYVSAQNWPYQTLNVIGALAIGINAFYNKAKAIGILEIFWVIIGIFTIAKTYAF